MGSLALLIIVGTTIWVGFDAAGRDFSQSKFARSTAQWVIGSLGLWIVAFPAYLVLRGRAPLKLAAAQGSPVASATWAPPTASVAPPSSPTDSKLCPDCAELVRTQARKCRFCGYEFAP
jgi:hypothetical protein